MQNNNRFIRLGLGKDDVTKMLNIYLLVSFTTVTDMVLFFNLGRTEIAQIILKSTFSSVNLKILLNFLSNWK